MSFGTNIFDLEVNDLGNENYLHFINIELLNDDLVELIDERIVSICEGCTSTDLGTIKKRLITFLTPKKGSTTEMGAIAEFFTHLYLNEVGFKQDFLFLNLEEGSIKKGFDGYYSRAGESWIYESKSGSGRTKGISHKSKIKEAHADLDGKITGNTKNNPWQNAYSHANQLDVKSEPDIRKKLKKMADNFTNGNFDKIENFNIIPGSTIFLDGVWASIDSDTLEAELKSLIKKLSFKKIHVVCVNKASVQLFWDYLES
jgi:hypothetical protein